MIVLDLDGTLLTTDKKILPKTKQILRYLSDHGNPVCLASGRPPRSVLAYQKDLGLEGPYICYNGAQIRSSEKKEPLFRKTIPSKVLLDFLSHFGEDSFVNLLSENDKDQYYLDTNTEYIDFFHPMGMKHHYGSYFKILDVDELDTVVIQTKETTRHEEMKEYLHSLAEDLSIRFWYNDTRFGEFYFLDVNKATSLDHVRQLYGFDRAHTICFGDAYNDIEMLHTAGISFAMKNGAPGLKEVATYITPEDNDNEGIYFALKNLFGLDDKTILQN